MKPSWVLISGCSSGIGRATAMRLAADGFHVLAGVRSPHDAAARAANRILPIMLDVTSESSIASAVERARQLAGEPGAIATSIWAKGDSSAQELSPNHPARLLYSARIDGLTLAAKRAASRAISPERAAAVVVKSITARRAPARVLVGPDARILAL